LAKAAFLTGIFGGIIGSVTAGIGIIWGISSVLLINELNTTFVAIYPVPQNEPLFILLSILLAILLVVSGVLTGVGFYGMYQTGGGAMGVVGLISGIIGSSLGAFFIFLGNIITGTKYVFNIDFILYGFTSSPPPLFIMISTMVVPQFFFIGVGVIIIAITFIMFGATSIAARKTTTRPSVSIATGILSVIGGCFLLPYILGVLGGILAQIGFGLLFIAFVLWAVVFYSSKQITIPKEEEVIPQINIKIKHTPMPLKINCLYCGSEIPKNAKVCPSCGAERVRCAVCNLDIVSGELFSKCPYCNVLSHREHLLEWIKIRGMCPNCKKKLSEIEIS
jgi:hypothetical protein